MTSDALVIVCTRHQSSRLPGKAVRPIAGIPAIQHIINRLRPTGLRVVLAIPASDWGIFAPFTNGEVGVFAGNPDSPLHRMAEVLRQPWGAGVEWVVRVTHDDILIDAETVTALLNSVRVKPEFAFGYASTPGIVEGAGVEVIHRDNLLAAADARQEPTEFVSYFVRGGGLPRPNEFVGQPRAAIARPYRLTMDYPGDAMVLDLALRELGPARPLDAICAWLDRHQYVLGWNMLPTLSVYICAYNAAKWIGQALDSVVRLAVPGLEVIVVDDGSTDSTALEVSRFSHVPHLRLIQSPTNEGLASASNRALAASRGRYVMRLDADDALMPVNFSEAWPHIKHELERGAVAVYTSYQRMDEAGEVLGPGEDPHKNHHVGGTIFDKRVLNELRFRDGLRHWDGLELFTRLQKRKAKVVGFALPVWLYRERAGSMSRSDPEQRAALRAAIEAGE